MLVEMFWSLKEKIDPPPFLESSLLFPFQVQGQARIRGDGKWGQLKVVKGNRRE